MITGYEIELTKRALNDAQKLKDAINNGTNVYIKGELEIAHPDNRVEYELWYSSILDIDYDTLYDIALY